MPSVVPSSYSSPAFLSPLSLSHQVLPTYAISTRPPPANLSFRRAHLCRRVCPPLAPKMCSSPSPASDIARSFIQTCTAPKGAYQQNLAIFCAAVSRARAAGFGLDALLLEVSSTDAASEILRHPLASEEVELRTVWVTLVFKTLRARAGESVALKDRFDVFVENIAEAKRKGYDQKRIQLEQSLQTEGQEGAGRTELENAILQQSVRIVLATLELEL